MRAPELAYGMLSTATADPRARALLRGRPSLASVEASPRVQEALRNPRIDRSMDVREGAGAEMGAPVTLVDKDVPRVAEAGGKAYDPAQFVNVHEQVEEEALRRLRGQGVPVKQAYDVAHTQYADKAERQAVEASGIPWRGYQNDWRDYLRSSQHERGAVQNPRVDPAQTVTGGKGPAEEGPSPELAYEMLSAAADPGPDKEALKSKPRQFFEALSGDVSNLIRGLRDMPEHVWKAPRPFGPQGTSEGPEAEYDPGPPTQAALMTMGGGAFAGKPLRGTLGTSGGRPGVALPMDEASRVARMEDQHYTIDAYHGTQTPHPIDEYQTGAVYREGEEGAVHTSSGDPNSFLGPHFAKEPQVANKFAEGRGATWLKGRYTEEARPSVYPTKLSAKNVHKTTEGEMNEHIFQQEANTPEVEMLLEDAGEGAYERYDKDPAYRSEINQQAIARERQYDDPTHETAEQLASAARRDYEKRGVTTIEYPNEVEGGTSYIAIAPPRSRFARFDPANAESGYILGAGATRKPLAAAMLAASRGGPRHEISKLVLPRPIEEMSATHLENPGRPIVERPLDPASMQGGWVYGGWGDRARAGTTVTEIGGTPLPEPYPTQGGFQFMAANEPHGAAWASYPGAVTSMSSDIRQLGQTAPVYLNFTAMAPRAIDFSHMPAEAMVNLMRAQGVPRAGASALDEVMRTAIPSKKAIGYEDWPGAYSPNLTQYLLDKPGAARRKFMQAIDTRELQDLGLPSAAEARFANIHPDLLDVPTGTSGYAISRMDPQGRIITDPEIAHRTYPHQMVGTYEGRFAHPVPFEDMYFDVIRTLQGMNRGYGIPPRGARFDYLMQGHMPKELTLEQSVQRATQEWVDRISAQQERASQGIP